MASCEEEEEEPSDDEDSSQHSSFQPSQNCSPQAPRGFGARMRAPRVMFSPGANALAPEKEDNDPDEEGMGADGCIAGVYDGHLGEFAEGEAPACSQDELNDDDPEFESESEGDEGARVRGCLDSARM